ncbi:hypothetical protein SAMN05216304_10495 [Bosea sp. OK403]|uniref:hypothetical protein n=1 Tax=Bosea sp. OK403 TaxID=1855286 RepID=UPI0008E33014|nr:hypothetical protein [Bosea sp. OK403]SFJ00397.1 hypothetical protein SAMN05216304_10495 [Bosea sp. OK403]
MTDIEKALPGYTTLDASTLKDLLGAEDLSPEQWQTEFYSSRDRLIEFLKARDPFVVLARTAARFLTEQGPPSEMAHRLEQPEVEITQALILMYGGPIRRVPSSPSNLLRYWPLVGRHIHSFVRMQKSNSTSSDIEQMVASRARIQTLYYRNLFSREDCILHLSKILRIIDKRSIKDLGYRLSDLFTAMIRMSDIVAEQFHIFCRYIRKLLSTSSMEELQEAITFFCSAYPTASMAWRDRNSRFTDIESLRNAAFQMSELAYPWVFTVKKEDVDSGFSREISEALYKMSLSRGDLSNSNPQHIYLDNPIWRQPYIRLENGDIFNASPQLIFSFPFLIAEKAMKGHEILEGAYEKARADYLEAAIAGIVRKAMPNATVYESVTWTDPETGQNWENDVVALLGNFVFVFEAKSGRINDAARRGGMLSLNKNFKELFIEPGLQAWRLQNYLDTYKETAKFFMQKTGEEIHFYLDRPKVVFRFSICFEHFIALTSANYYLKELGLITKETAWAPVISLGELEMIAKHLDTEVSFQHYLTRRSTIEEMLDFDGDEQDLLSVYLTNGMWFDNSIFDGAKVIFHDADSPVRQSKIARKNRSDFEILGVSLSPLWVSIARELYANISQRHRFDMINVILNQLPPALADFERRIRRFRRGEPLKGQDVLITKFPVGNRIFVLACHLAKTPPDPKEWQDTGRSIMGMFAQEHGAVECAFFRFERKTKQHTHDAVSFYRYGFASKPDTPADKLS